jgi:hypothetical protein
VPGPNVAAVRAAVPSAHWLVVTRASTKTTPPIAASSSQSAWLAATNPDRSGRPARFPARIEPVTAMPRHWPICRHEHQQAAPAAELWQRYHPA